jgi:outer membrane protein insertion porin family
MKKLLLPFVPFILFANVEDVKFEGLIHLSDVSANEISLIKKGDEFNLKKIDDTIKKFYSYEYFQNIEASYNNNVLTFKFIEKPVVRNINYNNFSDELIKAIKETFSLKKGEIYKAEKFEEIKTFITDYYEIKGIYESSVFIQEKVQKNFIDIDLTLKKGNELFIKELNFIGNKTYSKETLESELDNKERDILGWVPLLFNDGKLNVFKLMQDENKLKDFYMKRGFLDVKIDSPLVVSNFDNYSSTMNIKIDEGKRYRVKNIEIEIDKNDVINIEKVMSDLALQKDRYFNIKNLRSDINYLKTLVSDKGYAFVKIIPDIEKKDNITNIKYRIITGNKVYISDVLIKGNKKTLDRVIRRNIYLAPGNLYSSTDKKDSVNALNRTGYFENVDFQEIRVDDSHIKILVTVEEGLTGSFRAGVSYNSYSKFGINAAISERNIFGSGQTLSLDLEKTSKSTSYEVSLQNPNIFDTSYSFNTSVYKKTFEGYSYDSDTTGASISFGKKIGRNTSIGTTYKYEDVKLSNYDTTNENIREKSTKSSISPYISYDNTDNYFFPTTGMKLSSSLEFAGVGGTEKFLKNINSAKFFHKLETENDLTIVGKYKAKFGIIQDNGYIPINDKFYLGGLGSIRGFSSGSISPADTDGHLIGGDKMFEQALELSIPISLKSKLWASAFIDQGGIGNSKIEMIKSSYGLSIDWVTPVGPLSFVYAIPLQSANDDKKSRFEFNIGVGF